MDVYRREEDAETLDRDVDAEGTEGANCVVDVEDRTLDVNCLDFLDGVSFETETFLEKYCEHRMPDSFKAGMYLLPQCISLDLSTKSMLRDSEGGSKVLVHR